MTLEKIYFNCPDCKDNRAVLTQFNQDLEEVLFVCYSDICTFELKQASLDQYYNYNDEVISDLTQRTEHQRKEEKAEKNRVKLYELPEKFLKKTIIEKQKTFHILVKELEEYQKAYQKKKILEERKKQSIEKRNSLSEKSPNKNLLPEGQCPDCYKYSVKKTGKSKTGFTKYKCENTACKRKYFQANSKPTMEIEPQYCECGYKSVSTNGKTSDGRWVYNCKNIGCYLKTFIPYKKRLKRIDKKPPCPDCGATGDNISYWGKSRGGLLQYSCNICSRSCFTWKTHKRQSKLLQGVECPRCAASRIHRKETTYNGNKRVKCAMCNKKWTIHKETYAELIEA